MRVDRLWPDCTYRNGEWETKPIPAFWVTVDRTELDQVVERAPDPESLLSGIGAIETPGDDRLYFLVSRDLSSIDPFPFYYPDSGQWNGRSPFRDVGPYEITSLDEVAGLSTDRSAP
jgi:hypothetical protein